MSYTPTKSNYVPLLNRLSEMQESPYYATAHADLLFAEQAIICLERELAEKKVLLQEIEDHRMMLSTQLSRLYGALKESYETSPEGKKELDLIDKALSFRSKSQLHHE